MPITRDEIPIPSSGLEAYFRLAMLCDGSLVKARARMWEKLGLPPAPMTEEEEESMTHLEPPFDEAFIEAYKDIVLEAP